MREIINYKKYRKISIILLLVFLILFLLPKMLNKWIQPEVLNYRILPLIWSSYIIILIRYVPRVHPVGRLSALENIYLESIVCAAVLTGLQFLAGSMVGELGESPYLLTPSGIFNNLLYVLPLLITREIIRSYALGAFCVKANIRAFVLITLFITLTDVNYKSLFLTQSLEEFTIFLAKDFGPLLSQNILLSYLALYGGSIAALSFLCVVTLFHWTSPILPVMNWLTEGAIGILIPIFSIMFIVKKYEAKVYHSKIEKLKKGEAVQWSLTALFSIGLIWFVIGVFPIVPSVIATGSMEPLIYPGDIILLERITSESQVLNLKTGDVIQFQRDGIRITHRITQIEMDEAGNLTFYTKGDNNTTADIQTVSPNDIKGIFIKAIPKLGYPTMLLKSNTVSRSNDDVEF